MYLRSAPKRLKVDGMRRKRGSSEGRRQGLGPLYRPTLPPRPTVPGSWRRGPRRQEILVLWVAASGPSPTGQHCRPLVCPLTPWPTTSGTPAVGHNARCTFVENFDSTIYFRKSWKINYIKKFYVVGHICIFASPSFGPKCKTGLLTRFLGLCSGCLEGIWYASVALLAT
jgi:hypothetical protein